MEKTIYEANIRQQYSYKGEKFSYINLLLPELIGEPVIGGNEPGDNQVYHYNDTTLIATQNGSVGSGVVIRAFGRSEKIAEIEGDLVKRLKNLQLEITEESHIIISPFTNR